MARPGRRVSDSLYTTAVLNTWPLPKRLVVRRVAIGLMVAGVLITVGIVFLGPGWSRPWMFASSLVVAMGGWLVLVVPGKSSRAPRRVQRPLLLFAGIFFTFATIGPLLMFVIQAQTPPPVTGLVAAVIAGIIACGWASAFTFRAWWAIPATIAFQIFAPQLIFRTLDGWGIFQNFGDLSEQGRRGSLALQAVLCLVIGYILVVRFIRISESEQARGRAELDMARQIHGSLVPDVELETPHVVVFGRSMASSEMGGDLIDVVRNGDRTDIFLADVSGHGVRAGARDGNDQVGHPHASADLRINRRAAARS